jgi:mycoredoxin
MSILAADNRFDRSRPGPSDRRDMACLQRWCSTPAPGAPTALDCAASCAAVGLPFREVNIWRDAAASAAVHAVAGDSEIVPTVQVGDRWLVNPTVEEVCAAAGYDLPGHG